MAEKHKSKYKAPKDLEKSQKPKPRKDLKDYTADDKDGKLNPKSAGEKLPNVLRKTDKATQDDGKMIPKYEADDRLYKDLEDADWDPKTSLKRLKNRQDKEEKDVADVLKDKIENLTREQKERVIREYVRRKIAKILSEQAEPAPAPEEEIPADAPAPDAAAPTDIAPAPEAPIPAPAAPEAPAAETPAPESEENLDPNTQTELQTKKLADKIKGMGTVKQLNTILKLANIVNAEVDVKDKLEFYTLLKQKAIENLHNIRTQESVKRKK